MEIEGEYCNAFEEYHGKNIPSASDYEVVYSMRTQRSIIRKFNESDSYWINGLVENMCG